MTTSTQDVFARIDRERERSLAELVEFLKIPSISTDPAYEPEVERCADWLASRLREAGLATEKIATSGHPLVYAEWTGAGPDRPTILFYGHYDVQPPDPLGEWRHPPFEPTIEAGPRGEQIVARGATDDKGQSYAQVRAVAAMLAERGRLPVNVKFIVEGEEESGGVAIEAFVRADAGRRLGCDAVVVSDTSMWEPGVPAITYGLRGLAYFEIRVQGPNRDLHSGVYGGGVENPANALAVVLASLRDPASGRVLVPGFYDDVRPLAEWERREFAELGLDEEEVERRRAQFGPNRLAEAEQEPGWQAFLRQHRDLMQLVLLGAAVVSIVALQEVSTGLVIIGLTVLNAVLGLNQEGKAAESVAAMGRISRGKYTLVIRCVLLTRLRIDRCIAPANRFHGSRPAKTKIGYGISPVLIRANR